MSNELLNDLVKHSLDRNKLIDELEAQIYRVGDQITELIAASQELMALQKEYCANIDRAHKRLENAIAAFTQ